MLIILNISKLQDFHLIPVLSPSCFPLHLLTPLVFSSLVTPYTSVSVLVFKCLHLFVSTLVPAQPSGFEAEAELDSRIMLSWLWPVQDPIINFELLYWEANNPTDKVKSPFKCMSLMKWILDRFMCIPLNVSFFAFIKDFIKSPPVFVRPVYLLLLHMEDIWV